MKALVYGGSGRAEVIDTAEPAAVGDWVVATTVLAGICGSDLGIIAGTNPRIRVGQTLGHESVARVESTGEEASDLTVGELVVPMPLISCGKCRSCRDGNGYICADLGLFGVDQPGALAERAAYPRAALHRLPAGVDPAAAVLIEPLAVAVHAAERAALVPGEHVAVVGGGPVGVLCAMVAEARGCLVTIIEPNPSRRAMIADLGLFVSAGETDDAEFSSRRTIDGFDVVMEAAGVPAAASAALVLTRVLGRMIVVGVQKAPIEFDVRDVNRNEKSVIGTRVYTAADFARAVELVGSGGVDLSRFPVARFGFADVEGALLESRTGSRSLKVIFDPRL